MSMSKKDYEQVAGVIAEFRRTHSKAASIVVANLAEDLADMMGQQNPLFQRDTFLEACRPGRPKVSTR